MNDVTLDIKMISDIAHDPNISIVTDTDYDIVSYPFFDTNPDNNLDYISNLIENIFNRIRFKISNIAINDKIYNSTINCNNVVIKPSQDTIYFYFKSIKISTTLPIKLNIILYNIKFKYHNCEKYTSYHINILSAKVVLASQDIISICNNQASSPCNFDIFKMFRCSVNNLFIYDNDLNIALQVHYLSHTSKSTHIKYLRLLDKTNTLGVVSGIWIIKYRYFIINQIVINISKKIINYVEQFLLLVDIILTKQSNIIQDNNTKTSINDEFHIIENYVDHTVTYVDRLDNRSDIISNAPISTLVNNISIKNNIISAYFNTEYIEDKEFDKLPDNVYRCGQIRLNISDGVNNKSSILQCHNISYREFTNDYWLFNINDFKIVDLTSNLWKNILYKTGIDNLVEIKANYKNTGNNYYLVVNVAKIVINVDELYLKKISPLIKSINHINDIISNITNHFNKGEPLFIMECIVNHINTVLSYKPRGINLGNIIRGNTQELVRMGTIRDMELNFSNFTITNKFGISDLLDEILACLETELTKQGSLIIGHIGILKQIFSPGLRAGQVLNMKGTFLDKLHKYASHVSSDALELATRTSISIETVIDGLLGNDITTSKLKERKLLDTIDVNIIVRGITLSLLRLQSIVDPKQQARNKMRYGD